MRRALVSVVAIFLLASPTALPSTQRAARAQETVPNILVFITDDQRALDTFEVMPKTVGYFSNGVDFSNTFATTPLCCPSRASIFTGRYAHNHGVRSNGRKNARGLDQQTTSQRYLDEAGYRTGIVGKYLNGWDVAHPPPYFDEYAISKRGYFGARFGIGKGGVHTVRDVPEYSTNFISRKATQFLDEAEVVDDQPWLLYVTPFAPHHPAAPSKRYDDARVPPFFPNDSMVEIDRSDKPPHLAPHMDEFDVKRLGVRRQRQLRTLMSVDDLVAEVTNRLESAEETNTLVLFMSDNGYLLGEHGLRRKGLPYRPSIKIPLMMRWDGHVTPGIDERLAANIDIAPTVLDAANIPPAHRVDGKSLLDLWDREELLTEVFAYESRPDLWWASVISRDYQYVEYYGADETVPAFREYYDLVTDPWQLENLFADDDPLNDPDVVDLSMRLARYRTCPALSPCP